MKKLSKSITLIFIITLGLIVFPSALADNAVVSGSTEESVTFPVVSNGGSNAYITLSSSTGVAEVAQHNWIGVFQGYGNEVHHGFYKITQEHNGMTRSMIWAPSATTNKSDILTCEEIQIYFEKAGTYKVTVTPLSTDAAMKYWKVDYIHRWVHPAKWMLTIQSGCSVKVYQSATIQVNVYFGGDYNAYYSYTETINQNQYIYPRQVHSSYICTSEPVFVAFDPINGASTEYINFYYEYKNNTPDVPSGTTIPGAMIGKQVAGDADGNGRFDVDDLILMVNYYLGSNVHIVSANCDLNGNGISCDVDDLIAAVNIYLGI